MSQIIYWNGICHMDEQIPFNFVIIEFNAQIYKIRTALNRVNIQNVI